MKSANQGISVETARTRLDKHQAERSTQAFNFYMKMDGNAHHSGLNHKIGSYRMDFGTAVKMEQLKRASSLHPLANKCLGLRCNNALKSMAGGTLIKKVMISKK